MNRVISCAMLLVAALIISFFRVDVSHASGGQCRWEGGAGHPTFPSCRLEDCIGEGGLAQCTKPVFAPYSNTAESKSDANRWRYGYCKMGGTMASDWNAACRAAGGTYVPSTQACNNLPPAFTSPSIANDEALMDATAHEYIHLRYPSCNLASRSDSGWGFNNAGDTSCGGNQTLRNGELISDVKRLTYDCATLKVTRNRALTCPTGFFSRTKPNGDVLCYIPAEDPCCKVGNPVSLITGAKLHEETDYRGGGIAPLEFKRYYHSKRYFRLPGTGAGGEPTTDQDFWAHSYQRHLTLVAGNPELIGVLHLEDGSLRHFDGTGKEILNRSGAAWTLVQIPGVEWQLTLDNHDVERYDLTGRLASITTRGGVVTTLGYDAVTGRLTSVANSFGHALALTYDGQGRLGSVTLPGGGVVSYGYDVRNRPETVTHADLAVRRYHYEDSRKLWLLSGITDENNSRFSTYTYDTSGRVSVTQHAGGVDRFNLTYSSTSVSHSAIDALGENRGGIFENRNGVMKISSPHYSRAGNGSKVRNTFYDAQGNVSQRRQFVGPSGSSERWTTTYAYDLARNLETSRIEGRTQSGLTTVSRTITTQWHSVYRLPTEISVYPNGTGTGTPLTTTTYTHDTAGNILTRTVTDPAASTSRTWTYTYDTYGRMLTEDGPRTDVSDLTTYDYYTCSSGAECGQLHTVTNAAAQVTTFNTYNAHGQPLEITDPNGVVTTLTYDARQRLTSRTLGGETNTFEYWPTGLLKKATLPDGSYVEYTYDAAHRLIGLNDDEGNRIEYTLNAVGNRTAENVYDPTNVLARAHTDVFDTVAQISKHIAAAATPAVTTTYGHNANGMQTSIAAPLGRSTSLAYDELNRLKQITNPASGLTKFAYDANDNIVSITDPRNKVTSYQYNGFGEVKQLTSPDTGVATSTYDSGGNLATRTDARGKTGTYAYDVLNRPTSVTFPDQTLSFIYDSGTNGKGRLTGASDANHSLAWTYDAQGRVVGKGQTVGAVTKSVGYSYVDAQLASLVTPSGQTLAYSYANGRVSGITLNGVTPILHSVLYEPFGPISGWTWGNGTLAARVYDLDGKPTNLDSGGAVTYGYDDAFRITGVTDLVDATKSWTYGYDSLDRLNAASTTGQTIGYTYDANSNRLTQSGTQTATYTISSTNNRVTSITGTPARTYSYDLSGNVTGYGALTYGSSDSGRMISATNGGVTTTYVINALGQRVKKSNSAATLHFFYDEAGHLVGEYDAAGALVQETIWLEDILVATLRPDGSGGVNMFYVHTDHLNTPRRISRPSDNAILWRWDSDPFGSSAANEDPDGDTTSFVFNPRFPGQYFDAESGLSYNYFRDYDPAVGGYIQSDPIGLRGGVNTYAYVRGNPLLGLDRFGLFDDWTGKYTRPIVETATRCLASAGAVATAIGGGLVAIATPTPTSACDTVYKPDSCSDDCDEITRSIYDAMNVIRQRIGDLLADRCNLFQLARNVPNPNLPPGCFGTWEGHIEQADGWQQRLRNLIDRAQRMGCQIPPDAWLLASRSLPRMPRGYYPGGR
jgi:RHS repeat-associated protein